jgi:hypothetical protein
MFTLRKFAMKIILSFIILSFFLSAQTLSIKGYGLVDPTRYHSKTQSGQAGEKASEIALRKNFLFLSGCLIQKNGKGYEITDEGYFQDAGKIYFKSISPVLYEAKIETPFPEAFKKRAIQNISFRVSYTEALNLKDFHSTQKYYLFIQSAIVQKLGDELVKKGLLRNESGVKLDYLFLGYTLGSPNVDVSVSYLVKK